MTAQRIVLTSPWKLGLFVFLLVAGTGFGLLYAYIELFGDQLKEVVTNAQSLDERITLTGSLTIRQAYLVLGAIAVLSLTGYIAVVSSARPLDRVVRGGRKREQALRRLEGLQDPRNADFEDFEDEPGVVNVLERWTQDRQRVNELQVEASIQHDAIAALAAQLRDGSEDGFVLQGAGEDPALNALVDSINAFVRSAGEGSYEPADVAGLGVAVRDLAAAESDLSGFVGSMADHAGRIARMAQTLARADGSGAVASTPLLVEGARQTGERLHALRAALEELAEQANRLAITMALQLNRLGDAGNEMIESVEDLRAISTRYQRLVMDLKTCEAEHAATVQALRNVGGVRADAEAIEGLQQQVMVLDQNAEALREVLGQMRRPLATLRAAAGVSGAVTPTEVANPSGRVQHDRAACHSAPAPRATEASAGEQIYEIADLGGRLVEDDMIHDLEQFGAVRL